ncbi:hypothetical protein [Oribacterium sp. oral taxon 078]|uniref:hypothetical protein n=1 Tax=Oribacterium sp. oral taxon 078 TaxID=652706 RepID=UPI001FA71010
MDQLEDGDRILISEGCTHQRQCGDIGSVQLLRLLKSYTGKELCFRFSSGRSFPEKSELSGFRLSAFDLLRGLRLQKARRRGLGALR